MPQDTTAHISDILSTFVINKELLSSAISFIQDGLNIGLTNS